MSSGYRILDRADTVESFDETNAFALDVLVGLSDARKSLPSKYLYDAKGSRLFHEITHLKEYYPTDCEIEILETQFAQIGSYVKGKPFNLVELGAAYGRKARILMQKLVKQGLEFQYVPIDISEGAMKELVANVHKALPNLEVCGLVSDYFQGLKWLNNRYERKNFVIFLGSSIGNFTRAQSRFFLRNVWSALKDGDNVMVGFDLKKDIELLLDAYNDSKGITAEFNINLLRRINNELGGEFDTNKFRFFCTYDVFSGAMESYLVSLKKQVVYIDKIGLSFSFEPWEPIHTEYSYKYLVSDIETLAVETGFLVEEHLFDSKRFFTDSIWHVNKPGANGLSNGDKKPVE